MSATATHNVVLKAVEPLRVASIRGVVPSVAQIGETFERLFGVLEEYLGPYGGPAGPPIAIYHNAGSGSKMLNMKVELAFPVAESVAGNEQIAVHELPRVERMGSTIHYGPWETINEAYAELLSWAADNGWCPAGMAREIYLSCGDGNPANFETEVQLPVGRI